MDPKFDWAARVMRRLGERKALAQIEALVSNLPLTFDDIKRHLEFSPGGYTRNTLFECDAFELKRSAGGRAPLHRCTITTARCACSRSSLAREQKRRSARSRGPGVSSVQTDAEF